MISQILGRSLLDRAGLSRREIQEDKKRYDAASDEAGQIKDPDAPI